jgi:regulator of sigma E protease
MIDESMDKEAMKEPAQPWEFRSKPAWQRLIIMIGGVTVNALLAWAIYSMSLFTWGQEYLPVENAKYGFAYDSLLINNGFQDGDKILRVDTNKPKDTRDVVMLIMLDDARKVTVDRDGKEMLLTLPADFHKTMMAEKKQVLIEPRVPFVVDSAIENNPAAKAGMKKGDQLLAVNDLSTPFVQDCRREFEKNKSKKVNLTILRNTDTVKAVCEITADGKIGVQFKHYTEFLETKKTEYGFFESIPAGLDVAVETLVGYVKQFKLIFTKEGASNLGSFGTLGSLFPDDFGPGYWQKFWGITALLSVILAFMNLLPIPALDGGHVLFLLYEITFRRKPGEKFMEYAQMGGMILLFALMAFALFNDVVKFFF